MSADRPKLCRDVRPDTRDVVLPSGRRPPWSFAVAAEARDALLLSGRKPTRSAWSVDVSAETRKPLRSPRSFDVSAETRDLASSAGRLAPCAADGVTPGDRSTVCPPEATADRPAGWVAPGLDVCAVRTRSRSAVAIAAADAGRALGSGDSMRRHKLCKPGGRVAAISGENGGAPRIAWSSSPRRSPRPANGCSPVTSR
jgi:hypothetical protein